MKICSTGPSSTIRPAYITTTRWHRLATSAMLCVMSIMAVPSSRFSCFISWMICACTVTSRAVVGSSAMSSEGSLARPMAIIALCRMPPENWWG